jgi:hypothetical protein
MYNCTCVLVSFIRGQKINHLIGSIDGVQRCGKKAARLWSHPEAAAVGSGVQAVWPRCPCPPKAHIAEKKLKENPVTRESRQRRSARPDHSGER